MIQSLVTSAVVCAVASVGVGAQLYFAHRRWKKQDEEVARERAERDAEFAARMAQTEQAMTAPLQLSPWTPWQPDPQESEERLQRILAEMDAVAHDPELEQMLAEFWAKAGEVETKPANSPAPKVTVDLSRELSEAGYAGGSLRVAAFECVDATHFVVHLEVEAVTP